jgi:GNAT superfamily N-acetyltransferase
MMPLVLRPGEPRDMASCGEIISAASRASVIHERMPGLRDLFEDSRPLAPDGRDRLVAEQSGRVAGFADYEPVRGHIRYLFVDPARQGSGIGAALVDAVQAACGGPVSVNCFAANDVSLAWYLRRGFEVETGWLDPDWHGVETVWLRLVRPAI